MLMRLRPPRPLQHLNPCQSTGRTCFWIFVCPVARWLAQSLAKCFLWRRNPGARLAAFFSNQLLAAFLRTCGSLAELALDQYVFSAGHGVGFEPAALAFDNFARLGFV